MTQSSEIMFTCHDPYDKVRKRSERGKGEVGTIFWVGKEFPVFCPRGPRGRPAR